MAYDAREAGAGGGAASVVGHADRSTSPASPTMHGPRFLGPQMVALAALACLVSGAISFSAFGNFVGPVAAEFGVPRSKVAYGTSLLVLAMGLTAPFVGRLIDHGRTRGMMTVGAVAGGLGMLLLSRAESLGQVAFVFVALIGVGSALFGTIPAMALVTSWYERHRGFALGFAVAGATLASWAAPASAQALIDAQGWRTAAAVFGGVALLVAAPLFALFVVARPEQVGQVPDGERASELGASAASTGAALDSANATGGANTADRASSAELAGALPTEALVRDSRLWLLAVGFGLLMTSSIVLTSLLVEYAKDLGFGAGHATRFMAAMMPCSLLGKFAIGALADVAPIKPAIAFTVVVNALVWGVFWFEPGPVLFLATGALYGLGIGGALPLQGVAVARCFGRANFGRANAIGAAAGIPLLFAAPLIAHTLEGRTGDYQLSFQVQGAVILLGGLALAFVRFPARETGA